MSNPTIAIITGGSRGLGQSTAMKLAEQGTDVILTYRTSQQESAAVVTAIEKLGRKAVALPLDVGKSASFDDFAAQVRETLSKIWQRDSFDFLVNNAGTGLQTGIADTTEAEFDELVNVQFKGVFFLTQKLLPLIADGGRIVNISSGLTRFAAPGSSAYAAVKGAVEVLTRYQAKELGSRGIAVNTVAAGPIETDFRGGAVRDNPEINKILSSQTALDRVGLPDDIGGMIALLLLPANGWINAQRIEASGGIFL